MEETAGSRGFDPTHSCKKLDMLTFNFDPKCPANLAKMESGRLFIDPASKSTVGVIEKDIWM